MAGVAVVATAVNSKAFIVIDTSAAQANVAVVIYANGKALIVTNIAEALGFDKLTT